MRSGSCLAPKMPQVSNEPAGPVLPQGKAVFKATAAVEQQGNSTGWNSKWNKAVKSHSGTAVGQQGKGGVAPWGTIERFGTSHFHLGRRTESSRVTHRRCLVFPLPSQLRQRLSIAVLREEDYTRLCDRGEDARRPHADGESVGDALRTTS